MLDKLAVLISRIFNPVFLLLASLIVALMPLEIPLLQKVGWFVASLILGTALPLAVLYIEKKRGNISSWFIFKREERFKVHLFTLISAVLYLAAIYGFGGPKPLLAVSTSYAGLAALMFLSNFIWKISGHTIAATLFVLVLLLFLSIDYWPAISLVFLVAWSRWHLRAHKLEDLISAVLLTSAVTLAILFFFGLASF
ncbi:MAG: hypothetical protein A2134_01025 [Candidatus Woykebacteria bacterium RBG_16_39_9b]|uniref:Phosphatidic acid phosphatase type 2/haloperoxidase domain-containing protein n=1 Tax=Candidatus Woykebacteria bacterium RBG_16_39_9b TaxID=1802595 RepID=A0A1G1WDY5_9BACT|nr:MAG: hypothetical protein A2134_01025 [Candidatus Woykebacteria bacterium RBG_16_39_9b]